MRMLRVALPFALFAVAGFAQLDQKTNKENMVRDRGRTPVQPPGQVLTYGRVGTQDSVPYGPVTVRGLLVDAGCRNRSTSNLYKPVTPLPAATPNGAMQGGNSGPNSVNGITVDQQTLAQERADILPHLVPDMLARQADQTCSVTGQTTQYSVLLQNGRFIDLDYAGDTLANEVVFATPQGQAMLNGTGPGVKMQVTVSGRVTGNRIFVEQLTK